MSEGKRVSNVEARVLIENAMELNYSDEQWEVVKDTNRPISVVSCAGSGKTTVLIARLLYKELVEGIKPYKMLVITFNKKASEEIEQRYRKAKSKLGNTSFNPSFHTFHAFFLRLLRTDSKYEGYEVTNPNNYLFALADIVKQHPTMSSNTDMVKDILSTRSKGINNMKDYLTHNEYGRLGVEVIERYEELLSENNEMDFDDMLLLLYREIFEHKNESILDTFKESYELVLIDEFQDISGIQYDIIEALTQTIGMDKLTCIGDDDQSIYQFRGSNPRYITQFGNMLPSAKTHLLTVNYRCPQNILEFIAPSIYKNEYRVDKALRSSGDGGEVQYLGVTESEPLVQSIKEDYHKYGDVAVLVRNNHQKTVISDQLVRQGLPVDVGTTMYTMRNNQVFKRLTTFINMIRESNNHEFIKNYWLFGIGRNQYLRLKSRYRGVGIYWVEDVIEQDMWGVSSENKRNIRTILRSEDATEIYTLAMQYLERSFLRGSTKGFYRMGAVEEYYNYIKDNLAEGKTYTELQEDVNLYQQRLDRNIGNPNAIQVVTMHTVKGLEYDSVVVYDPSDNEMFSDFRGLWGAGGLELNQSENEFKKNVFNYDPRAISVLAKLVSDRQNETVTETQVKDRIEEERRLFYVASTRAMKKLTIATDIERRSSLILEALELRGSVEIPVAPTHEFVKRDLSEVKEEVEQEREKQEKLKRLREREKQDIKQRREKGLQDLESLLGNVKEEESSTEEKTMSLGNINKILGMGED